MFALLLSYLFGAISILILEVAIISILFKRLVAAQESKKRAVAGKKEKNSSQQKLGIFTARKQGLVWVGVPNSRRGTRESLQQSKASKEIKLKRDPLKESFEQNPMLKNARIAEHLLILSDADGREDVIDLKGCNIVAVSGGDHPSRKWAKKYPIKLESNSKVLGCDSKLLYMYFETSSEKEAWCKCLRLASALYVAGTASKVRWFFGLKKDFEQYLARLNEFYPSLSRPYYSQNSQREKLPKDEAVSSKVRVFLKKIARKASKSSQDGKSNNITMAGILGDRKSEYEPLLNSAGNSNPETSRSILPSNKVDFDSATVPSSSTPSCSSPKNHSKQSALPDLDSQERVIPGLDIYNERGTDDQGRICCNQIFFRLFFDARRSPEITASVQALIQKLLSKLRTPSFISGITCTRLDIGNLPPYICKMRALPVSKDEEWTIEVDIEYSGGAILEIETRVEAPETVFEENSTIRDFESDDGKDITAGILNTDFGGVGDRLDMTFPAENKSPEDITDAAKVLSAPARRGNLSRWKGVLTRLADQVSQVPLSLSVQIYSLKGTLRISIKPPPSDRLWFGFIAEPDIEWGFEPSIGDHKITFSTVADVIASRIKAAIRDNLVLPNREDVYIPWMQAEKDDWVPKNVAPHPWIHRESSDSFGSHLSFKNARENSDMKADGASSPLHEASAVNSQQMDNDNEKMLPVVLSETSTGTNATPSYPEKVIDDAVASDSSKGGILCEERSQEHVNWVDSSVAEDCSQSTEEKPKRSKRERMKGLGKKMTEKLEEKKRHLEERSRLLVEKMRGVDKSDGNGSDN